MQPFGGVAVPVPPPPELGPLAVVPARVTFPLSPAGTLVGVVQAPFTVYCAVQLQGHVLPAEANAFPTKL